MRQPYIDRLVELRFAEGDALLATDLVIDLMADAAATGWLTADGHVFDGIEASLAPGERAG